MCGSAPADDPVEHFLLEAFAARRIPYRLHDQNNDAASKARDLNLDEKRVCTLAGGVFAIERESGEVDYQQAWEGHGQLVEPDSGISVSLTLA